MSFLVDTNVLSELRKRQRTHPSVAAWAKSTGWERWHTSWIVVAEMRCGELLVRRNDKVQAAALDAWITEIVVRLGDHIFPVDRAVAEVWPNLMVPNPRSPFDALIAATALVHQLPVVTRNVKNFAGTGIDVIDPWSGTSPP